MFNLVAPGSVGVAMAALLVVVLLAVLPAGARGLARQPAVLLGLHVLTLGALRLIPPGTAQHKGVFLVSTFLLLGAIGRGLVVLVLDVLLGRRLRRPLPRIATDLTQGIVWIGIVLVSLPAAGVDPGSILTTSALLTAAIALSLQETLGNLVAGLAIQVQRPFDVDDWIQFDAELKHIGRVLEINWRATKVLTLDEVEVTVPNATLAKAPIVNFTKPTKVSRRSLYVYAPVDVPPHLVQETILGALPGSLGLVAEPAPSVVTNGFVEGNVEYWVRVFTDQFHKRDAVDGAARDRIWYALRRVGVTPSSSPNRAVHLQEVTAAAKLRDEQALVERERAIRGVDFLAVLSEEQRRQLALASQTRLYVAGEPIVKQGDGSAEMFVLESGQVEVVVGEAVVARLGDGKFFGEMALMTGEKRNATVRAAGPCRLLVIDDRALRGVLETAPQLAEHISRVIADRQAALAASDASSQDGRPPVSVEERSSQLLDDQEVLRTLSPGSFLRASAASRASSCRPRAGSPPGGTRGGPCRRRRRAASPPPAAAPSGPSRAAARWRAGAAARPSRLPARPAGAGQESLSEASMRASSASTSPRALAPPSASVSAAGASPAVTGASDAAGEGAAAGGGLLAQAATTTRASAGDSWRMFIEHRHSSLASTAPVGRCRKTSRSGHGLHVVPWAA